MKHLFSSFLLFAGILCFSQNYTATYQLTYKRDSTNRADVRKENFMLMLGKDGSYFESEGNYVKDSLLAKLKDVPTNNNNIAMGLSVIAKAPRTSFNEIILKNYSTKSLTFYGSVGLSKISYEEKPVFNWKILPENKKIGELNCQKAETDFGGRHFTAWFTNQLPFQDGPYKFAGLPGLIVEIFDSKDDYHYSLISLKNEETVKPEFSKYIQTTKQKYYKSYENFRANPEAVIFGARSNITFQGNSGSSPKDRWAKVNNGIELKP